MFQKKSAHRFLLAAVVMVALFLIGGRLYLPYWLTGYVNHQIEDLDGYGGTVQDIDVKLWRGTYQIHGINIYKDRGGLKKPFFMAETVELSLEWRALLNGAIVAKIDVTDATMNFSKGQTGEGANWPQLVDALSPFDIDRLDIHTSKVAYIDYSASPDVNIYIHQIEAQIENLRQITDKNTRLPSPVRISGISIGGGKLLVTGRMNILQDVPDFDLDAKLENSALPAFNDYAHAFAGVDFEKGTISVYTEMAAANGKVVGYVKFVANDISVNLLNSNPFNVVWKSLASGFMQIFKNHPKDQFAMRIPIEGDINNPERDTWAGFMSIFKNTFVRAYSKDTDGNINFNRALLEE